MKKTISILCVLAMAISLIVMPVQAAETNLVSNSGFESGNINGWTVAQGATAVVGKEYAYTGDRGVLVTPSAGSAASEPSFAYRFPVEANKKYFINSRTSASEHTLLSMSCL